MPSKPITPFTAYSVDETAERIGMHPMSLRRKLAVKNDPFIEKAQPVKIGKEWRFMGENILKALGSVTYTGEQPNQTNSHTTAGVATQNEY